MTKRENILEAAEVLFAEHGYEGTSVRMLAQKAKINVAMVSYYFGSKEKLFETLVEYRASFLREKLKGVNKEISDPVKRIEVVVDLIVDRIFSNPRFHMLVHREITLQQRSKMNERIVAILMKNIEEVRKMLKEGVKLKLFRNVDIEMLIFSLFSTTSQVAHSSLFSTKLLGESASKNLTLDENIKNRLKIYLKDFLKHYLLTTENQSK